MRRIVEVLECVQETILPFANERTVRLGGVAGGLSCRQAAEQPATLANVIDSKAEEIRVCDPRFAHAVDDILGSEPDEVTKLRRLSMLQFYQIVEQVADGSEDN